MSEMIELRIYKRGSELLGRATGDTLRRALSELADAPGMRDLTIKDMGDVRILPYSYDPEFYDD